MLQTRVVALATIASVYLGLCLGLYAYAHSYTPPHKLVVLNPYNYSFKLVAELENGSSIELESSSPRLEVPLDTGVASVYIEWNECSYRVLVRHRATVYVTTFPSYFCPRNATVVSYSVYNYPWSDAPWGLEIMVGTEGAYVEESLAGRVFNLFYTYAEPEVADLLDEVGVEDEWSRLEVSATALWAVQLVEEVKSRSPDLALDLRALEMIVPKPLAVLGYPLFIPFLYAVHSMDREHLYRLVLEGVKSVERYVEVFPVWKSVREDTWVEMCRRLESKALKEIDVPSYAHTLLAGVLVLELIRSYGFAALAVVMVIATLLYVRRLALRQACTRSRSRSA